jgi:hypothetical protein
MKFKYFNLLYFYNKTIIVQIGNFGTSIVVIRKNKIIDYLFQDKKTCDDLKNFDRIFQHYKNYNISFLLDSKEAKIYHEILPVVQNIIKSSPVEKFISQNISDKFTVAFNVLEISKSEIETWLTIISLVPFDNRLRDWVNYIINYDIKFFNIYHLQLESFHIFDRISSHISIENRGNYLQIFVIPTKTFGIFIFVRNKHHVVYTKSVEYLESRVNDYLEGVIENEIQECLNNLKSYIVTNNMKTHCVVIIKDALENSFKNHNLNLNQLTLIPISKLNSTFFPFSDLQNSFCDSLIAEIFSLEKNYPAINKETLHIQKIMKIYNFIFKPFQIAIVIMILCIIYTSYSLFINKSKFVNLNKQLIQRVNKYNKIKSDYPDQDNFDKILDYYSLNNLLKSQIIEKPYEIIDIIINNKFSSNIIVNSIDWIQNKKDLIGNGNPLCQILLKYSMKKTIPSKFLKSLDDYINYLKESLVEYHIEYFIGKQGISGSSNISSIDVTINLSKIN